MSLDYRKRSEMEGKAEDVRMQGAGMPSRLGESAPMGLQARLASVRDRLADIRTGLGNGIDRIAGPSPTGAIAKEACNDTALNLLSSIEDITDSIHDQVKAFHDLL